MKQIKRVLTIAVAIVCMAIFAACGGTPAATPDNSASPSPTKPGTPSIIGATEANFFPDSPQDVEFNVNSNKGTFQSLKQGTETLVRNQDFAFNIGTEILTLKQAYLIKLEANQYTFTFTTSGGKCDIKIKVNSIQTQDYDLEFAKKNNNPNSDHFFAKTARSDEAVTLDFITFGDFTREGSSLKFINILFDLPPLNNEAVNWKFNGEDRNVRIYSDGTVIYRDDFTGQEIMAAGKAPGQDNIWWKINREAPNYKTLNSVSITRENGVTKFSLSLANEILGIGAGDAFRFNLSECSDNSATDFALYENGILTVEGVPLEDPVYCKNWATMNADGSVIRPGGGELPADDTLRFAAGVKAEADAFEAKIEAADNAVTFSFKTDKDFGKDIDGSSLEFVNLYIDMPAFNTGAVNWRFNAEDVNIRVYSDGTVFYRTDFNGESDNLWYKTDWENGKKLPSVAIKREAGVTTFSLTVTMETLGNKEAEAFRFYLKECSDQSDNDFAMYDGNMSYGNIMLGDPVHCDNWATFTVATNTITTPPTA